MAADNNGILLLARYLAEAGILPNQQLSLEHDNISTVRFRFQNGLVLVVIYKDLVGRIC
ncbi:uncharacterized protein EI90DRAFT_3075634 [Cantharellus anzutake]|uniref:uncharacterized protein n=1 Tax=Cantharellus anzutake TaxID=1750568 RepID=UPI0019041E12|nr:uncharacterized protein EI90DRAFT_3075634 [Cantharellus anzutake]KAF8324272.1 hypothetical protein EI90DRAFT_3075634 [Cantharellus anzutake]